MIWTRRRWLAGAGVAMALPWLERDLPMARAQGSIEPRRFLAYYVPNGMPMSAWSHDDLLAPLLPWRDKLTVIRGLRNKPAEIETAGHHAAGTAGFLTGARPRRSESAPLVGLSLDHAFALHHGQGTPFDVMALGLERGDAVGNCDNGFSCAYSRNISWSSPTTPRPKIVSPRLVFELLFAGDPAAPPEAREQRLEERRSVLDFVATQARTLQRDLGHDDRTKIDAYFEAVRAVERRIDRGVHEQCPSAGGLPPLSSEIPSDREEHLALMHTLIVLALQCDATRAIPFMLANSASNAVYSAAGVSEGHHDLSHHGGNPARIDALEAVARWEITQFAALLGQLDAVQTLDGTLLDHCAVLFSSELSDGNRHRHDDLPVILAGSAGGTLHPGADLSRPDAAWASLLLSIGQALGVPILRWGDDGETPLDGV